jgi:hypothetical protein
MLRLLFTWYFWNVLTKSASIDFKYSATTLVGVSSVKFLGLKEVALDR